MVNDSPYAVQTAARLETHFNGIDYTKVPQEESCQYLSVTVPEDLSEDEKLPVMVWFHGGSYRNGGCDASCYNRTLLTKEGRIVCVGINSRLGVLGFVRDREGNYANSGILDIIEGLRWVKSNIAAFGGDENDITLFGHSSGADSVRSVMLAEGTEDLYNKVILQSDPIGSMEADRSDMDRRILEEMMEMPIDADLDTVRQVQTSIISHVVEKNCARHLAFGPHYGVYPLPERKDHERRLREIAKDHPMFIGSTTRESSAYIYPHRKVMFMDRFPLTRWYVEGKLRKPTEEVFVEPIHEFAKQYASIGGTTYYYRFYWREKHSAVGACHGSENALLFGTKDLPTSSDLFQEMTREEVDMIGKDLRAIWTGFAKTGEVACDGIDGLIRIEKLEP